MGRRSPACHWVGKGLAPLGRRGWKLRHSPWWALRSVGQSVHPGTVSGGQPADGLEGAPWLGGEHERQHCMRMVGSWQRPSRRSLSQNPKDRRSRSQPGVGEGQRGIRTSGLGYPEPGSPPQPP